MMPPEKIRTERLLLRKIIEEDAGSIFAPLIRDEDVTKYLPWKPLMPIEDIREFVLQRVEDWQDEIEYNWIICLSTGRPIGCINLEVFKYRAMTGFMLEKTAWNQGYATEALQAVLKWARVQPEIYRVWAYCDIDNRASARVLEKAGMEREGILHRWRIHPNVSSIPRDCYSYACYK